MIWDRERYIAHCKFEYTGREMFCELFGPLVGLDKEWEMQGATKDEIEMVAFDWDYVLKTSLAANCGAITGITESVLVDNEVERITIDKMGRKMKLCKQSATIPLPMEHPVSTPEDWEKVKHWYAFDKSRVNIEKLKEQKKLRDQGYLTTFGIPGGFDQPRQLLGEEELCIACYTEPEMITDMLNTMADTAIKTIEYVYDIVPIDYLSIHEDMAGKSGPLFGPKQVDEFMKPYYNKVWNEAKRAGAQIFCQDSDGNMNPILDNLLECGLTTVYPCEPGSGMDIVEIRKKYGKAFTLKGGIDKYALRADKEAIRKELEYKICDLTKGGGTIFALDHRIPNGVSLENYKYYVNLGREMLGIEPITQKGWERMAF